MTPAADPSPPVVRFAPSPTGYLHVGSAHSALANALFARAHGGRFLLRIEDTDPERSRSELVENVLDMLRWLGLHWDGEPVLQAERSDRHRQCADQLAEGGHAYWCACTTEEVQARAAERGGPPGYDGHCRDRGLGPGEGRALRFAVPHDYDVVWHDLVRGEVRFSGANVEDFVLVRSSGQPVFVLANAVDDADMGITHVIRGEDHVNSTPKYLLVRGALGLGVPTFAHMPLLVNEARKKLSKRRDDVSVADYRDRGFLPEAMVNYLALLGWGPPDGVEAPRTFDELASMYSLEAVTPSPAFFDVRKLEHVNGEWIRALPEADFVDRAGAFLPADQPGARPALEAMAPLVQERAHVLTDVVELVDFLYLDEPVEDEAAWQKHLVKGRNPAGMLDAATAELSGLPEGAWQADAIRAAVERAAVAAGITNAEGGPQLAKAQGPVRVALTGRGVGPPLFESIEVLGRERTLARLAQARSRLV